MFRFLLTVVLFLCSNIGQAKVIFEPRVGLHTTSEVKGSKSYKGGNALGYGAQLTYNLNYIYGGLDFLESRLQTDLYSSDFEDDTRAQEWGLILGVHIFKMARIYGGYIFEGKATSRMENDQNLTLEEARGAKLGVTFDGHPWFSVFLEYREVDYGKATQGNSKAGSDFSSQGVLLGISLPINR